mmetsp:Transcript_15033/g.35638  ORF Transcript_15033/g.35638 Transcript_15033/m.35638 type:complete len:239 (-) Transcript_15033:132-848(-)
MLVNTCKRRSGHPNDGCRCGTPVVLQHFQPLHEPDHAIGIRSAARYMGGVGAARSEAGSLGGQYDPLVPLLRPALEVHQHAAAIGRDQNLLCDGVPGRSGRTVSPRRCAATEADDLPTVELGHVVLSLNTLRRPPTLRHQLSPQIKERLARLGKLGGEVRVRLAAPQQKLAIRGTRDRELSANDRLPPLLTPVSRGAAFTPVPADGGHSAKALAVERIKDLIQHHLPLPCTDTFPQFL